MSFLPPGEKIVETKKCRISGQEFIVTDKDLEFYDKISPIFAGKKYSIPSPTLCPDERMRRRMCFRNSRHLYFSSEEGQLSTYSKSGGYTSFQPPKYWSDLWTPTAYNAKFSFDSLAFTQLHTLDKRVPKIARSILKEENCNFVNQASNVKDCYLIYGGDDTEKCYYGERFKGSKNCIDFLGAYSCEYCYEIVDCMDCFGLRFSQECTNCHDSSFLYGCSDCKKCFGCINLRSKEYYFFNEQLSPAEYTKRVQEFSLERHKDFLLKKIHNFFLSQIYRENMNLQAEGCVGNKIVKSKNVFYSYYVQNSEDIRYCADFYGSKDCYDIYTFGDQTHRSYECVTIGHDAYHCLFTQECWEKTTDLLYCMHCTKGTHDCFLSTGLKKHDHCILNIPYSVQEYEQLAGKIIDHMKSTGEWGEFFPHELSPFAYNETVANEYFPMTEEEVRAKGWNWHTEEDKKYEGVIYHPLPITQHDERVIGFETAQKNIDAVLAGTIVCEVTGKPFKIIKQELAFYIENGIPIPKKHPDQRHKERLNLRNPRTLYERTCSECGKDIMTTYAPNRPEKVVCEECYRKIVY
ncbi:MAG: hypothetical protein WC753_00740 [Candidatus Gracilibacteria bacterium]